MRVLVVSHSALVASYRQKWEFIAWHNEWDLHLVVPQRWPEGGAMTEADTRDVQESLQLHVLGVRLPGRIGYFSYAGLKDLALALEPDLVYAEEEPWSLAGLQSALAARAVGAKFVYFSWENIARRFRPPLNWVRRRVLAMADAGIVGSSESMQVYRGWGFAKPMALIPQYGVDTHGFKPRAGRQRAPLFGYVGRLMPEKGIETLIRAAAATGLKTVIVGQGPQGPKLRQLAAELKAPVVFKGFVPFARRAQLYHGFDVLVLPSLTTAKWKEQFGRVLIEAMASGLPCIGSDSGAIAEVVGEAGLIFHEGDAAGLADAMQSLAKSAALRKRLGKKARARAVKHYAEGVIDGALTEFLESLFD